MSVLLTAEPQTEIINHQRRLKRKAMAQEIRLKDILKPLIGLIFCEGKVVTLLYFAYSH